jgi:WXG100 family type VII secretion target
MRNDVISANYPELEGIARRFQRTSERIENLRQTVEKPFNRLKNGGWEGRGADSFFSEMDRKLLPAMVRLREALAQAARATGRISRTVHTAEEEAAALFRGNAQGATPASTGGSESNGGKPAPFTPRPKISGDSHYVSNTIGTTVYQAFQPQTNPLPDPERQGILNDIFLYLDNSEDQAALLQLFPQLAQLDTLTNAELEALLAMLAERQSILDQAYALELLRQAFSPASILPDNLELMSLEQLRTFENNILVVYQDELLSNFGFWILTGDSDLYLELRDQFFALSRQDQVDFLYSLYNALPDVRNYIPGTPLDESQFPPILFISENPPTPELQALLETSVTRIRELMTLSVTDAQTRVDLLFIAPSMMEMVAEEWLDGGGVAGLTAMMLPPNIRRLSELGISSEGMNNLFGAALRMGSRGVKGMQRLWQFMSVLPESGLRRLANSFDIDFNVRIFDRLTEIRSLPATTRGAMGYTDIELKRGIYRTDIPVEGQPSLVYGATRNNDARALSFEYMATGKPDPTIAIYAPTSRGAAEFDWYRTQDGHLVLMDAKLAQPYGLYDLESPYGSTFRYRMADEALRQSEAARLIGQNVTVEWIVPNGTSQTMVDGLQAYLEIDLGILNINVVRAAP